ncbi:MAG: chromate transporter [Microscillaceae bacterium]|nr:chromate transporter [Microscillaceae bacterium]
MNNLLEPVPNLPLEKELLPLFTDKAPFQLPTEWREAIVKYSPYVMMILAPLSVLAIGLSTLASIFSLLTVNFLGTLSLILSIVSIVLDLMAIPGLFATSRGGWKLVYLAWLISLLSNLLSFSFLSIIPAFLIGGFFLFQVRSYYK